MGFQGRTIEGKKPQFTKAMHGFIDVDAFYIGDSIGCRAIDRPA